MLYYRRQYKFEKGIISYIDLHIVNTLRVPERRRLHLASTSWKKKEQDETRTRMFSKRGRYKGGGLLPPLEAGDGVEVALVIAHLPLGGNVSVRESLSVLGIQVRLETFQHGLFVGAGGALESKIDDLLKSCT
ncbi:hypothetical protein CDAR_619331 [Caerostris darwini]|uniref:Uncharacterized protein n=1 Tax=Caerostris darwini TaxID=1538125 RepID=A0AAV4PW98_9ARAC|nr:hypothetical protein CDAR_619331 [Caerostris darwini]